MSPRLIQTRRFLCFIGMIIGLWLIGVKAANANEAARPNVILFFADDLGYGELGCQGNPEIPTPHIDSIAAHGVRFTSGYVTASYCSPSRAGLMAGRYQTRFGFELNPVGERNLHPDAGLPLSERTLAEQLKQAGYATGLIGKWHLGGTERFHPLNQGFDVFYGFLHEGHFYAPPPYEGVFSFFRTNTFGVVDSQLLEKLGTTQNLRMRRGRVIWSSHMPHNEPRYDENNPILKGREPLVESKYLTDALAREALSFIDAHKSSPFFLYVSYNAVHSPMQARGDALAKFKHIQDDQRRIFAAMLSSMDDSVGAVLEKLRAEGLESNSLIFFISDNGGPTRELTSSNAPLRGGKGSLYEGGVRVPFLLQWKGRAPEGAVYHAPVLSTDVYATASAAAGIRTPDVEMDGVDLLPFVRGETQGDPHHSIYWRMGKRAAFRKGDWKIVEPSYDSAEEPAFELYHLAEDLEESKDLSAARPQKLEELVRDWKAMNQEMKPPVWHPGK